jgi:catechol 2,3-dioxygenase-like lactoylglutathione lyase family enzyme
MRKDNFSVELLQLADSSQVKAQAEQTFNHFTMYVNDINKTVERLKADGRVVFEPGGIVEDFGKERIQFVFFRAINGERIELVQASLG